MALWIQAENNRSAMLREIKDVNQERGAGRRRWFESEGFELVVWLDTSGNISGFQFCYDVGEGARALTWREAAGFSHSTIDGGDDTPWVNRTPVLLQCPAAAPIGHIGRLFEERGRMVDPALHDFIARQLKKGSGRAL